MFAQDTTITIKFGGIKFEYALFKFFIEKFLGFYFGFVFFLFPGCYSFRSAYALCPVPYAISANQK
jgi:hypothetical protein